MLLVKRKKDLYILKISGDVIDTLYKIGVSGNSEERCRIIAQSLPFVRVELLRAFTGSGGFEKHIHAKLRQYGVGGEYFRQNDLIDRLISGSLLPEDCAPKERNTKGKERPRRKGLGVNIEPLMQVLNAATIPALHEMLTENGATISQRTLYKWSNGGAFQSDKLEEVAKAAGVSAKWLIEAE